MTVAAAPGSSTVTSSGTTMSALPDASAAIVGALPPIGRTV
jgi:hypothetical protein